MFESGLKFINVYNFLNFWKRDWDPDLDISSTIHKILKNYVNKLQIDEKNWIPVK